jgi:hypothetical protein
MTSQTQTCSCIQTAQILSAIPLNPNVHSVLVRQLPSLLCVSLAGARFVTSALFPTTFLSIYICCIDEALELLFASDSPLERVLHLLAELEKHAFLSEKKLVMPLFPFTASLTFAR